MNEHDCTRERAEGDARSASAPAHPAAPSACAPAAPGCPAAPAPACAPAPSAPASSAPACAPAPAAPDLLPGDGVLVGPSMLTRRQFAAAAAATLAASALAASRALASDASAAGDADGQAASAAGDASDAADASSESEATDSGYDNAIDILATYEDATETLSFEPLVTFELPLGSVVYSDCDARAAVIQANDTARPLTLIGCLDYAVGNYTIVLDHALTGEDYAPSECHLTERVIAWVEMNNATDEWALYAAPFDGSPITSVEDVVQLGTGDADWLPPQFAVWENRVVWQVMPDPSGPHVTEDSRAYLWRRGSDSGTLVWSSPGRFACAPAINDGVLTIAPRVNASEGVYYGLTAIDLEDDLRQIDQLVLPVSVRPFIATHIGDDFAFSVEANYGYGGLLGTMGYFIGPSAGPFLNLTREPSAQIGYVGDYYVLRSQLLYFLVDVRARRFGRILSASNCVDYGDYPASSGTSQLFVTYAAIKDESTGIPSKVLVRLFSLT